MIKEILWMIYALIVALILYIGIPVGLPILLAIYSQVFYAVVIPFLLIVIVVIINTIINGKKGYETCKNAFIPYIYAGLPYILAVKCVMWYPEHLWWSIFSFPFLAYAIAITLGVFLVH